MYNEKMIKSALVYAYKSGYNIVFVQVRGRGYAYYNSDIVPKHPKVSSDFDPLEYAVTLGHALGIEVHAWVNSYILWSSKQPPSDPHHLYYTHKEWTEADRNLKMDSKIKLSAPQSPQWEGIYLSPIHPEVNPYLLSVYSEIINEYKVDGIHLDYIRFQDKIYGWNRYGMKEFEKIYDFSPRDITRGIIPHNLEDSIKVAWIRFRQDAITELVKEIYMAIRNSGKDIELSAAVKANLVEAQSRWYQDWDSWIQEGIIDFVVPMNYFKEIRDFNNSMQIIKSNLTPDDLNLVIIGVSTHNQDAQSVVDKVHLARLNGFTGVSIFAYDSHKNNLDWFKPVTKALKNASFE
jgi:uncharacterized lipoprotein YddW (UPF0748 family)